MSDRRRLLALAAMTLGLAAAPVASGAEPTPGERLAAVSSWFYYLDVNLSDATVGRIESSSYEMVVIDPIVTEKNNTDYPIGSVVGRLQRASTPKLVLAYLDIGEAESYRTYWKRKWRRDAPSWVLGKDPDGWVGNFPVAYWQKAWQRRWLKPRGIIDQMIAAGFDGIYLDWTEAYSDHQVRRAARRADRKPRREIVRWVSRLAKRGRREREGFLVINQNAAELPAYGKDFLPLIDAQAQEQTWFDGAANNRPPGDCPLPATDREIETKRYYRSLSRPCRRMHDRYPDSTLHVSSEWYLKKLRRLRGAGIPVFTVDYAVRPANVDLAYCRAREEGFVPFTSNRWLDTWREPYVPQAC